jgi:hypothetical protein
VGLIIGTRSALLEMEKRSRAADASMFNMDAAFLLLLFLTALPVLYARVPRNRGDGNAAGHPFGRGRGTVHYVALGKLPTWSIVTPHWCATRSSRGESKHTLHKVPLRVIRSMWG